MTQTIEAAALTPFVSGLAFPEGPRWRDGALWCSDIADGKVLRISEQAQVSVVAEGLRRPSGLGWLPDGRLLLVAGEQRQLWRREGEAWALHADLSSLAPASCNDMVVDAQGRAYVGNWGFDYEAGGKPATTVLLSVDPDGQARVVADDLAFPNGTVITADGRTLIVAETFASRLSAFDIGDDGSLSARRVWAATAGASPDGICLDAEGAIWLASPPSGEVIRVLEGGAVTHRIKTGGDAVACMLGGADRRSLFVLSTQLFDKVDGRRRFNGVPRLRELKAGRIDMLRVDVPGAGWP
jgi:sugar lactone lactonase YvrE